MFAGVSMITMGPDTEWTGLPVSIYFPFISEAILGIGNVLVFIPVIPDMMESLERLFPHLHEDIISDIASAIFSSGYALGAFLGPSSNFK